VAATSDVLVKTEVVNEQVALVKAGFRVLVVLTDVDLYEL
jgi:hypothetical protein